MVGRAFAPIWSIAVLLSACNPTVDSRTTRSARNHIVAATVIGNGLRSDGVSGDETKADCATFRLTPAQVLTYFAQARTIDDRTYNHDADMSRCYATGTVRLPDGEGGTWTIDRARRGHLMRPDGSHRYLLCASCAAPPFFENDDPADDG